MLFNLAGMAYFDWLVDITDDEWDRARREEVDLIFYLTRAAWPHLKTSGGVILNMASLNASLSFRILPSLARTTNKAGIIAMTRQLATEGREHGIRASEGRILKLSEAFRDAMFRMTPPLVFRCGQAARVR